MPSTMMNLLQAPLGPALRARVGAEVIRRTALHGSAALTITMDEMSISGLTAERRRLLAGVVKALRARSMPVFWRGVTLHGPI